MSGKQSAVGEDVVVVPRPLDEDPLTDRHCDLVLTGGVASGVVYPWAILELARKFNFKNIGGTSVGAMAAALAAAAEYGRRNGYREGFEVLRRLPGELAKDMGDGRTRLLSLFQPAPAGRRLFSVFVRGVELFGEPTLKPVNPTQPLPSTPASRMSRWLPFIFFVLRAYALEILLGLLAGLLVVGLLAWLPNPAWWHLALLPLSIGGAVLGLALGLRRDVVRGLVKNNLGLCAGGASGDAEADLHRPALVQWLHNGIQQAAGLDKCDRPLTFRDLWNAPSYLGADPREPVAGDNGRSINLEMITTNVTHGRPYRLPMIDETSRLFYRPEDLVAYFPPLILQALVDASVPYAPRSVSDPPASDKTLGFLELPGADLPLVVAARLSLSYPVLFSAVPLYAIDAERKREERDLRRCWFSDGGLCSNFPIHLFDAAMPAWPTFGMWLGKRSPYHLDQAVFLPPFHLDGRGEAWQRFDPDDPMTPTYTGEPPPGPLNFLSGFLLAGFVSAKDWGDRSNMRLPHTRKRVARLGLRPGEGELNIAMKREQILRMAHEYGVEAGTEFVKRYVERSGQAPTPDWQEQRWVRWQLLVSSLRTMLKGFSIDADRVAHTVPLKESVEGAKTVSPVRGRPKDNDPMAAKLTTEQADALKQVLVGLRALEQTLMETEWPEQPYKARPEPELKLRLPL